MDTFLPHTAIDYPVLLNKALPPGDYTALVKLAVPGAVGAAVKTVIAKPSFSVSNQDVTQVFTSSKPSQVPTTGLGDTQVSSSLTWALIAARRPAPAPPAHLPTRPPLGEDHVERSASASASAVPATPRGRRACAVPPPA
jgi:hypothetical protein